ncbi:hypothetical protein HRbin25_00035 [bacterium HR25]|nr:hypothetical protein HRbin25_00035 [bacterium HR25]
MHPWEDNVSRPPEGPGSAPPERPGRARRPSFSDLVGSPGLRQLLQVRTLGQVAQNAILYTLLIVVVQETHSSLQTALLLIVLTVPSIVLGIPAGALADVLPLRAAVIMGALARVAIVCGMLVYQWDMARLYFLAFVFATVGSLTGPAEWAAVSRLVSRDWLPRANSLYLLVTMLGQVGGAVVLAPLLFKIGGAVPVFVVVALLYLVTAYAALNLEPLPPAASTEGEEVGLWQALTTGWRVLANSSPAFMAMVYLTISSMLMKTVAVLAPHYVRETLNITAENTVYVMVPAALGAALGLVVTPFLSRFLKVDQVMVIGFLLLVLSLAALGLVVYIRDVIIAHLDLGVRFVEERLGVSSVITLTLILAVPSGLAATMVTVAARSVLHRESPVGAQARVFATQSAVADLVALLPTFLLGGVADLLGARPVLLLAALVALAMSLYAGRARQRFAPLARASSVR